MKKKILLRFFTVTLVAVLLMFAFGILAVHINTTKVVDERLREETELAAALLSNRSDLTRFNGYESARDFRITVFDAACNVLYESDTTAPLENHSDREELRNALAGSPDTVTRYSETFRCDMTYYAVMTTLEDGEEVILRLAVKSSRITSYITSLIPLLLVVLAAALCISFLLSGLLSESISARVTEIGESLRSLSDGTYAPIRTDMSEPELFTVLDRINDLNARIHEHIRVAESERSKLNTVLDNVSQSIVALDADRRIAFANRQAYDLFGGTERDVGRGLVFLIEELPLCERITEHLGTDHAFTCTYRERALSVVICRVTDAALSGDVSSILIVTDITKEKLIERQKSDFFANASHELKTPITVLQGLSEVLLTRDGIDDGTKSQLTRIHKESKRLGSLIADMLTLSSIETGDLVDRPASAVSLTPLAEEIFGEMAEEIGRRQIRTQAIGGGTVTADPRMLYELVENLISNAVKYNVDGGSITVSVVTEETGALRLQVTDTGIGIGKEHLPRLCERFYRVDRSHSKRIGGTGLGLAIVKHICSTIGATLDIASELGVGTTVTVSFPAPASAD